MKKRRRKIDAALEAKIALEAPREQATVAELTVLPEGGLVGGIDDKPANR